MADSVKISADSAAYQKWRDRENAIELFIRSLPDDNRQAAEAALAFAFTAGRNSRSAELRLRGPVVLIAGGGE